LTPNTIYTFKITARNSVGSSLQSASVSIRAAELPDAPINLVNVPLITTAYQIGLDWKEGVYNGGSPVIDYRVTYKVSTAATFSSYKDGVVLTELTVIGLTPGVYYTFRVEARSLVGYSEFSSAITELAA